jgi:hypothetical protein
MARFERQDAPASESASVATATDELRSTVEQQLRKIVEAAESRAAEIEGLALEKASRIERESERRARDAYQAAIDRAYGLLTVVESMERELQAVRAETESLVAELETSSANSAQLSEPEAESAQPADEVVEEESDEEVEESEEEEEAEEESDEDFEDEPNGLASAAEPAPDEHTGSPEVREMLREQLVQLRESGKPRPDAERFLTRFTQGERHLDLLDEIYSEGDDDTKPSASRRRRLRRRRAKQSQNDSDAD